jgi:uncharacterized phage protein gp47/JayE
MSDFPTFSVFFRTGRDEILTRNENLALTAVDRDGSDANVMLAGAGAMAEEVIAQLADVAEGLFLGSARGQKLDKYLFDRYGLVRKQSSASDGTVAFTTTVANPTAFTIPANTLLQTADGLQLIVTGAVVFPAASTGPVVVPIRSVLAGADQRVKIGTITSIVSTITGAPDDLVVTNSVATAGGADKERDESFRDRGRRFFRTARKGTLEAIEAAALAVSGVVKATAIEVLDVSGRPARVVELIVTDEFTDALVEQGASPPAYEAQSQQLSVSVFNSLSDTRGAGIFVLVRVAQVVLQPVLLQLRFQAGVDTNIVALAARATALTVVNGLSPGVNLDPADITRALRSVAGLDVTGDEVVTPAGVVVPEQLQVIRTSLDLVVASVQSQSDTILNQSVPPDLLLPVTIVL